MHKFVLTDRDKTFVFDFTFADGHVSSPSLDPSCRFVKYELYRTDRDDKIWFWEGSLCADQLENFHLSYPDHIDIKGYLTLFQDNGQDYIFLDARYGYQLEEHFEGNIMLIPEDIPVDPPPIDPIQPDHPVEEVIVSHGYNDLFPYLYIRKWQDLNTSDDHYFMEYHLPSSPPAANFYSNLLQYFNSDGTPLPEARTNIMEQSYYFVNGAEPYEGEYLESIEDLPFPYNKFPRFYNEIQLSDQLEPISWESFLFRIFGKNREELIALIDTSEYLRIKDQLWQSVFALAIINMYNERGLEDYIKSLLVYHILDSTMYEPDSPEWGDISQLIQASIVLPQPVFPLPPYDDQTLNPENFNGSVVPYAIGDLRMVQNKLVAYRPGEIAHIENVLPGELKKVSNSTLQETQELSSQTHENFREDEDHWQGNLESLNNEISKTLNETGNETDNYDNLQTSYGPPTTGTYNGQVSYDRTLDRSDSGADLQFAKQILNRTVARMTQKLNVSFQKNQIDRKEEAIVHTLDNREGTKAIRGIYAWVNKIYSARVLNYGNRFLLEFLIDKPIVNASNKLELVQGLIPPSDLPQPINSFEDINLGNYSSLAAQYGVENVAIPPAQQKTVYTFFNEDKALTAQMLALPESYVPVKADITYQSENDLQLIVGDQLIALNTGENEADTNSPCSCTQDLTMYEPDCEVLSIPVVLSAIAAYTSPPSGSDYFISVGVSCEPSLTIMNEWRKEVYDAIVKAFDENKKQAAKLLLSPPKVNKQIPKDWVNIEVIRSCQDLLYQLHLTRATPAEPILSPPTTQVNEPAYYEFFGASMEWQEATYAFSDKSSKTFVERITLSLLGNESESTAADYPESDMLRVMVPVHPDFNYRMLYFLQTGLISQVNDSITPVMENAEPIVVNLKKTEGQRGIGPQLADESWEVVVPTNMQWLQNDNNLPTYPLNS